MEPIIGRRRVGRAFADGAYSSEQNFEFFDENNVDPAIPVQINAKSGRYKKKSIEEQLRDGSPSWHEP